MSIIRVEGSTPMLDRLRRLLPSVSVRTLSSIEAYAQWAPSYPPHAHNVLMELEESAMRQMMPMLAGQTVLDLACGTGRYGLLAQEQGAKQVIGLDNSHAMLLANPQKHIAVATTETLPLATNSLDVILCGLALGHLTRLQPSMSEISRVLRPGGTALVSDFHPFVFLNGGQRTFTGQDGLTYAVEHYPHLYMDYHRTAREAGLHIVDVTECTMNTASSGELPIVIVFRFEKMARAG